MRKPKGPLHSPAKKIGISQYSFKGISGLLLKFMVGK